MIAELRVLSFGEPAGGDWIEVSRSECLGQVYQANSGHPLFVMDRASNLESGAGPYGATPGGT